MEYTFLNIVTIVIFYSFAGWVMESIFRSFCEKKIINTGFLFGPFCPIYGIGALILTTFAKTFGNFPILFIFFISMIVMTFWEYIVGIFIEKIFHTKYWDYSESFMNYKGRICLFNSTCWGILGVLFFKLMYPTMQEVLQNMQIYEGIYKTFLYSILIVVAVDAIISIIKVMNIKNGLEKVNHLNEQIKELKVKLEMLTENKKQLGKEKKKEMAENLKEATPETVQAMIEDLRKKKNRLLRKLYRFVYRLKKAFPTLETTEIKEILSKKVEFSRKKTKNKLLGEANSMKKEGEEDDG